MINELLRLKNEQDREALPSKIFLNLKKIILWQLQK